MTVHGVCVCPHMQMFCDTLLCSFVLNEEYIHLKI